MNGAQTEHWVKTLGNGGERTHLDAVRHADAYTAANGDGMDRTAARSRPKGKEEGGDGKCKPAASGTPGGEGMQEVRQMPGISYRIASQDVRQAVLEYTYYCPYCMRKAAVRSVVPFPDYERLETGGFCENLKCSECGRAADVRFWKAMKIE